MQGVRHNDRNIHIVVSERKLMVAEETKPLTSMKCIDGIRSHRDVANVESDQIEPCLSKRSLSEFRLGLDPSSCFPQHTITIVTSDNSTVFAALGQSPSEQARGAGHIDHRGRRLSFCHRIKVLHHHLRLLIRSRKARRGKSLTPATLVGKRHAGVGEEIAHGHVIFFCQSCGLEGKSQRRGDQWRHGRYNARVDAASTAAAALFIVAHIAIFLGCLEKIVVKIRPADISRIGIGRRTEHHLHSL